MKNLKQKIFWHTIRQKPALSAYSMIAIASQYSDLAHGFNVYNGRNARKRPGEIVSGNKIFPLPGLICWHLPCVQVFYVCRWEYLDFKAYYLNLAFTEAGFLFLSGGRFFMITSDLGLPTRKIFVFVAGKNWKSVGLLYFSRTSLSFTFYSWLSYLATLAALYPPWLLTFLLSYLGKGSKKKNVKKCGGGGEKTKLLFWNRVFFREYLESF